MPVTVIANGENRGFPIAINQGIAASKGKHLVFLNNDTVVTSRWLDQLVALAESDAQIGLTGPMSNYVSPPQLVEPVDYVDLDGMHRFATRWREEHAGQWFIAPKLSGFCLLVKRRVLDAIGRLDQRFGVGLFDDDDLAMRARCGLDARRGARPPRPSFRQPHVRRVGDRCGGPPGREPRQILREMAACGRSRGASRRAAAVVAAGKALRERGEVIPDDLVAHLSPLGWEHINLTGNYDWKPGTGTRRRLLHQLRLPTSLDEPNPYRAIFPFRGVPPSGPYSSFSFHCYLQAECCVNRHPRA
jgi:hypothetical protein